MSMQTPFAAEIPAKTRRVVDPLLPQDSVYRLVATRLTRSKRRGVSRLYAAEGRPAVNLWYWPWYPCSNSLRSYQTEPQPRRL